MTRSKLLRPLLLSAFVVAPASFVALGCASEAAPPAQVIPAPGQLMLAVSTDMMPGKDFEEIRIVVTQGDVANDSTSFTWTVTGGEVRGAVKLPTTVAVIRGNKTTGLTSIRAIAYRGAVARVVREFNVAIPETGVWELPVRLEALCADTVRYGDHHEPIGSCGVGATCAAGQCITSNVDAATLTPYAGPDAGTGAPCLDVLAAFSGGFDATPRIEGEDCVLTAADLKQPPWYGASDAGVSDAAAADASTNDAGDADARDQDAAFAGSAPRPVDGGADAPVQFAGHLALRYGPSRIGFCTTDLCLVPLPKGGAGGWSTRGTRLVLPRAVCDAPSPRVAVAPEGAGGDVADDACGEWTTSGRARSKEFSSPYYKNGEPCTSAAMICAINETSCGSLSLEDPSCPELRTVSCGSCDGDTAGMVSIPGGSFLFGSPDSDPDASDDEKPQVRTMIRPFWIDRTEVTASAYGACVKAGACSLAGTGNNCNLRATGLPAAARDDHPINCVTWYQASSFCSWKGRRLPTQEEWEYEAKGGADCVRRYPWGSTTPTPEIACMSAEVDDPNRQGTCAVGTHPLGDSRHGVQDMSGSVWEWTSSMYERDGHGVPTEAEWHDYRTEKGGGWTQTPDQVTYLRSAFKSSDARGYQSQTVGFRCARDL